MTGRAAGRAALGGVVGLWAAVLLAALAGTQFTLAPVFLFTRWQNGASDIILADTAGRYAVLTPGPGRAQDPAWSPDGSQIAYAQVRGTPSFQLMVMNAWGRDPRPLTATGAANRDPQWLPDGETLVYLFERVAGQTSFDVFTLHLPTGVHRNLTDDNPHNEQVAVSPDGAMVAYHHDNRTIRLASLPFGVVFAETSADTHSPAWSPDGTRLAYVGPQDRFASSVIDTLYVLDATPDAAPTRYVQADRFQLAAPTWSPDGTQIAFIAEPLTALPSNVPNPIYLLDVGTGDVRQLTALPGQALSLDWSADGAQLLFRYLDLPANPRAAASMTSRVCIYTVATARTRCPGALVDVADPPRWRPTPR